MAEYIKKNLAAAFVAAFFASVVAPASASVDNPFANDPRTSGYDQASKSDAEDKCGDSKDDKEGECGEKEPR